jgi:6-pyruvoyltetrahydropterin/6-carboxytetrahydropterin synthase
VPTTENIAREIWRGWSRICAADGAAALHPPVRNAGPVRGLFGEQGSREAPRFRRGPVFRVTRRYAFAASHRLHSPQLERGRKPAHLRQVQQPVWARPQLRDGGERARAADGATGLAVEPAALDDLVERQVLTPFGISNLNLDVRIRSTGRVPTSENLAVEICRRLKRELGRGVPRRLAQAGPKFASPRPRATSLK